LKEIVNCLKEQLRGKKNDQYSEDVYRGRLESLIEGCRSTKSQEEGP
jgi:hypothetical protein